MTPRALGILLCASVALAGCAGGPSLGGRFVPHQARSETAAPVHHAAPHASAAFGGRQYYDQRRQRYYFYDPARRAYFWEDGSPKT